MNARTRLFGGEGGPTVRLEGTILAWIGLEGWLEACPGPRSGVADELRRRWRPSARFYAQVDRHCRGLDVATIRASADPETLARADRVLESMRRGLGRLRWPEGDRARAARLRVEVRNQATRVAAGRLDGPRRKGPCFDPRRLPDDRLLILLQRINDPARREALERERRARGL